MNKRVYLISISTVPHSIDKPWIIPINKRYENKIRDLRYIAERVFFILYIIIPIMPRLNPNPVNKKFADIEI